MPIRELSADNPVFVRLPLRAVYHLSRDHEFENGWGILPACKSDMRDTIAVTLKWAERHGLRICKRCEKILTNDPGRLHLKFQTEEKSNADDS